MFIAHRLKTISNSGMSVRAKTNGDKIIVLDQGTVAESGSHTELLALDGHYAKMWREQRAAEHDE